MRTLAEIFVIAALIYFGWDKPFKDWSDGARVKLTGKHAEVVPQEVVVPRTPQRGAWMWDPNHHGALDRPSPTPAVRP